ncbi:MAG: response regulator [Devosia sp.]|uniref:response regulator n=1 Tax=Devosia sp. TaxID=1871048 RepID=UPI003391A3D0
MTKNVTTALLLEDEPLISMDLEATLADAGFDVVAMMSCSDAVTWLDGNAPDVVIVDIMLRDGSSDAVVERLIEDAVPFIVHSGDHPSMHENTPFARGTWVSKPAEGDELVRTARRLVFSA